MDKPHRGVIFGAKVHVPEGDILMGLYHNPEKGRIVMRFTSLIVKEDGQEFETLNSRYTLVEGDKTPLDELIKCQGCLPTSL